MSPGTLWSRPWVELRPAAVGPSGDSLMGSGSTFFEDRLLPPLTTAGLFAGIGGFELGLERSGHTTRVLCEIWDPAVEVLAYRFPNALAVRDVAQIENPKHAEPFDLPDDISLLTAGFPCTDLSQAGLKAGVRGENSGLVYQVFRILNTRAEQGKPIPWVVIENVKNMLHLKKGEAMRVIIGALEGMGYRWAYRLVDSRAFGVPQRRQRVFLVASLTEDPRGVLFIDEAGIPLIPPKDAWTPATGVGFYWTEGIRGLGWAHEAVPTLKGGSTIGIPSSPAMLLPSGEVIQPDIRDAERMQGFEPDWTAPAENVSKPGYRWKLVGNAVTVDVAEWVGRRLRRPGVYSGDADAPLLPSQSLPMAAWGGPGGNSYVADLSAWPFHTDRPPLAEYLHHAGKALSWKAATGFLKRASSSETRLVFPDGFLDAIDLHCRHQALVEGKAHADVIGRLGLSASAAADKFQKAA